MPSKMTYVSARSDTGHIHVGSHEDNHDHKSFPSYYFSWDKTSLLEKYRL